MFKFLHAADLHLDSPLHGLELYEGAPVDEIRGATRRALDNLVQLAINEQVSFVLIAGDLYDGNWRDHNTGLYLVKRLTQLRDAGIAVYAISGNHDAASKMTRSLPLPKNPDGSQVMLSDRKPETILLEELGVALHGQGFARATVEENVIPYFPAARAGQFNIGLLHTSLDQEPGGPHARYAPCALADLKAKGYQYWALGHIHQRVQRSSDPIIAYPGNVQGRHIREAGPKGCLLVKVDNHHTARAEFRPLDVMRWIECQFSAEEATCRDDVVGLFASQLAKETAGNDNLPLAVRVCITGRCKAHVRLVADLPGLAAALRASAIEVSGGSVWVEKVKLETTAFTSASDICLSDGPLSEILSLIQDLKTNDGQLTELAKELEELDRKLPTLDDDEEDKLQLRDFNELKKVLDEVQALLIERLETQGSHT